jgi:hypothetical protein
MAWLDEKLAKFMAEAYLLLHSEMASERRTQSERDEQSGPNDDHGTIDQESSSGNKQTD